MAQAPVTRGQAQQALDALYECDGNKSQAARSLGIKRPTFQNRVRCAELYGLEPGGGAEDALPSPMAPALRERTRRRCRLVVTAAQNATPIDENFRRALERYCDENDALLVVVPFRYKNPTSLWTDSQADAEYWHEWVADHLVAEDVELNDNLMLAASVMIQPTAKRPLSGLQTYSHGKSAIFGHSKVELETVATPQNALPKLLVTTGCVTVENFTDTKTGKLGEHHHVLGATVVEIEDERRFHLRQLNACTDGSFVDLAREYRPRSARKAPRPSALVVADVHHEQMDPAVETAVFGADGVVDALRPRRLVLHDLLDFKSQNHHDRRDFVEVFRKHRRGRTGVYDEVRDTLDWLDEVSRGFEETVVVESNHDEAYLRWLNEGHGDKDPENAWFYHATWAGILPPPWSDDEEVGHPIEYWFNEWYPSRDDVTFLRRNESYVVDDVELGLHGDVGPNGSRGSARALNAIGVKNTIGHNHGPAIRGGVYQVGVCQLYMGYNERGPSNWLPAHCVQYHNGKRSLVVTIDELWCADREAYRT